MKTIAVVQLSGGLGNQLFQYAYALHLHQQGKKVFIDRTTWFIKTGKSSVRLNSKLFNESIIISTLFFFLSKFDKLISLVREDKEYELMSQKKNNMFQYYVGCWQHIDYLKKNSLILKSIFTLKKNYKKFEYFDRKLSNKSVAIHVRRGDYVNNSLHETVDLNYFLEAINIIKEKIENPEFYVFSDDIKWCKQNFSADFKFVDYLKSEIDDFEALKLFKHKIISNSTFSWWASYLSLEDDSVIICPKKWTTKNEETSLQLTNWIKI